MRVGHGFDVHKFGGSAPLVIGGVCVNYIKSLLAHSDGDVLIHAVIDALLGAAALGDIGSLFSNTKSIYKGIDSRVLLRKVWLKITTNNFYLCNIDITLIAQEPKMATYIPQMKIYISKDLDCHLNSINIKATTTEKLGFIGRNEGIACEAVVLLKSLK